MEKDYDEEVEEIDYYDEEPIEEEKELLEIEKEQSTKLKNGQVEFKNVNHSERAAKFGRVSDGDTTKYVNIALEYFGHRCALSGEKFESFDKKVDGKKSNLSAEHIVALCLGGDDIVPNIVPTVLQYNLRKNGYYLLDYWDKQKDTEGKSLYSPYRLLKLVNYMMKSIEARDLKSIKDYRKAIMTPNEIDEFLAEIEKQDELESDNSKKKIHSDTITATTVEEDNKKILTEVPQVEGNIPTQREQQERFRQNEIDMMDIFLSDAVGLLNRTQELQQIRLKDKDENEISLQDKLNNMLKSTIGVIPFEIEVRNVILEKLEALGIKDNKYSVANDLLNNTEILGLAKENRENVKSIVENYIENQLIRIRELQLLSEEQLKIVISSMPTVLYDEKEMNKIKLWNAYRGDSFEELISRDYSATDEFVDVLIILKNNGVDLSKINQRSKINDLILNNENAETIMQELQGISYEITKDWRIGARLNKQKQMNMPKLQEEIRNAGLDLTDIEYKNILEIENNQEASERATKEFVQVLLVLKNNGIDLSKINQKSKINDLILNNENAEIIMEELQGISGKITRRWPVGMRLQVQKRSIIKLKEEMKKEGVELTDKEYTQILRIEDKQELSERVTREFVQVLVVLKKNEVDLSKISRKSKINDLIMNNENVETIMEELQGISYEITEDWRIGERLNKQKNGKVIQKLQEEIKRAGLKLTEQEIKVILDKENRQELSERTTKEFVQVLVVLKKNGVDLSKIGRKSKINDLIMNNKNADAIMEELQRISEEIKKDWHIGERLGNQKAEKRIQKLQEEIQNARLELTDRERKKILETKAKKKVKQTVVEQKNKGELGQNQQIEEVFEETIRQVEQTQENENSVR